MFDPNSKMRICGQPKFLQLIFHCKEGCQSVIPPYRRNESVRLRAGWQVEPIKNAEFHQSA